MGCRILKKRGECGGSGRATVTHGFNATQDTGPDVGASPRHDVPLSHMGRGEDAAVCSREWKFISKSGGDIHDILGTSAWRSTAVKSAVLCSHSSALRPDACRTVRSPMARALLRETVSKVARRSVEELTDFLTDVLCKRDLKSLITEAGVWKGFVEAAELSSEEEAALYEALKEHLQQHPTDDNDGPQREQEKERFLRVFPQLKKKLEDHIKKLRDLADHLDQVHHGCTISNVVSSSVSTVSGILGLALLPFTGGASLILSATAMGLGVIASVNGLVTNIVEESIKLSDESEASRLVGASMDVLGEILKITPKITIKLGNTGMELVEAFKTLRDQIRAIRGARSISQVAAAARSLTSTGRGSVQGAREMGAAFTGSPLSMARGARFGAAGVTSFFLAWDVYHLVADSMDLYDGAKTESAGALRELCHKLDDKLQIFEQIYKALQSDLPQ